MLPWQLTSLQIIGPESTLLAYKALHYITCTLHSFTILFLYLWADRADQMLLATELNVISYTIHFCHTLIYTFMSFYHKSSYHKSSYHKSYHKSYQIFIIWLLQELCTCQYKPRGGGRGEGLAGKGWGIWQKNESLNKIPRGGEAYINQIVQEGPTWGKLSQEIIYLR